jgi:hypothetical protein
MDTVFFSEFATTSGLQFQVPIKDVILLKDSFFPMRLLQRNPGLGVLEPDGGLVRGRQFRAPC